MTEKKPPNAAKLEFDNVEAHFPVKVSKYGTITGLKEFAGRIVQIVILK